MRRRMMMSGGEVSMPNYLCFTALKSGTFTLSIPSDLSTSSLEYVEYSIDDGETWIITNNVNGTDVTITTTTISSGGSVLWRGKGTQYATSNSVYSTFSATANFNISGCLCSLLYLDDKSKYKSISSAGTYTFSNLFTDCTKLVSSADLVFPNDVKGNCYLKMFYGCSNHESTSTLPSPSIATQSYNRMYYGNSKLETAPIILATSASGNYALQYCFQKCTKLNYIKCLITSKSSTALFNWVSGVQTTSGIFVKDINASWIDSGNSGVPTNWTIIYYDTSEDKYYTSQDKSQECDDHGNPI